MMQRRALRSPLDRMIAAAIALLMFVALVTVYAAWSYIEQRADELVKDDLEGQERAIAGRFDGWAMGWGNGMRVEASYISTHDSLTPMQLADRWRTLMESYWPIVSMQLADERGNEVALLREDSTLLLRESFLGSVDGPSLLTRLDVPLDTLVPRTRLDTSENDPRTQEWFGQALRNQRVDPVWSAATDNGFLDLSQLIRPKSDSASFRVLAFTIDPLRLGTGLLGRSGNTTMRGFVVFPSGSMLSTGAIGHDTVAARAMTTWAASPSETVFDLGDGTRYRSVIRPHTVNGCTVHVGAAIDLAVLDGLMIRARHITMAGLAVILVLGALLIVAYMRKRRDLLHLYAEQEHARVQQARLEKAIGERDVLDRETHHRVKNNLQVVSSLLNLQAQRIEEGPVKEEFLRGKARIDTMALVHQKLYGLPDLRGVDLHTFFEELVRSVRTANEPESHTVSCEVETHRLKAQTDPAIDLGIILCELVNNCYQHAFPYATGGHIDVTLEHLDGDNHRLRVKDNGIGMGARDARSKARLGLEIVEALAGQLDGSFTLRTEGGVSCEVNFKMAPVNVES